MTELKPVINAAFRKDISLAELPELAASLRELFPNLEFDELAKFALSSGLEVTLTVRARVAIAGGAIEGGGKR